MRGLSSAARRSSRCLPLLLAFLLVAPTVMALPLDGEGPQATTTGVPPIVSSMGPAAPAPDATGLEGLRTLTEEAPLEVVEETLRRAILERGGTTVPRPDQHPEYTRFPETDQRNLWRLWTLAALRDQVQGPPTLGLAGDTTRDADRDASAATTAGNASDLATPRGLRGLWSLDAHGYPEGVLSAGDGGHFLVTSLGVLRFSAAGAKPDWMVKPGRVQQVETLDVDGDETLDLVLGIRSYAMQKEDPSLVIIHGKTGEVLFEGFSGTDRLMGWRLTDVDGDGKQDLVGLTTTGSLLGADLDGGVIWRTELPASTFMSQWALLAGAYYYFDALVGLAFADVDGDGVLDLVINENHWVYAYVFLFTTMANGAFATAYSGKDGRALWQQVLPSAGEWNVDWPVGSGDLDGDGRDDVVYMHWSYRFDYMPFLPLMIITFSDGHYVTSGQDGTLLAEDRRHTLYAFPVFIPATVGDPPYHYVIGIQDMDGDATSELITAELKIEYTEDQSALAALDVVGRTLSAIKGAPTEEIWRQTVPVPGKPHVYGFDLHFRDLDKKDGLDLLLTIAGYRTDPQGNVTGQDSTAHVVRPTGVEDRATPGLVFMYDIDAETDTAFVWTHDDRWVPVDGAGNKIGNGMRLVTEAWPVEMEDVTRDGIPDLLLQKMSGYYWVDGATGTPFGDIDRPINRWIWGVTRESGSLRILEADHRMDIWWLLDLGSQEDLWRFRSSDMVGLYGYVSVYQLADVGGDGSADVLFYKYEWNRDTGSSSRSLTVYDPVAADVLWKLADPRGSVHLRDALPHRPGSEIIYRGWKAQDNTNFVRLYVADEQEPRWEQNLGSTWAYVRAAAAGKLILSGSQEGAFIEVLDAETGEQNATYAYPADSYIENVLTDDMDGDGALDVIVGYEIYAHGDAAYEISTFSLARQEVISQFAITPPRYETESYGGYEYYIGYSESDLSMTVSDWDRDGWVDLATIEKNKPIIRSGQNGEVLAVNAVAGEVVVARDLNGDGKQEIGVLSTAGRLRFLTYDAGHVEAAPSSIVQHVVRPDEAVTEDAEFFSKHERGGIPGPGALLVLATLALLVGLVRRRR